MGQRSTTACTGMSTTIWPLNRHLSFPVPRDRPYTGASKSHLANAACTASTWSGRQAMSMRSCDSLSMIS